MFLPFGTVRQRVALPNCEAEWISRRNSREDRVVLYLHGGAWVMRTPRAHRRLASKLAKLARARVLLVFYRLAPEHVFPAALDDVLSGYDYLLGQGIAPEHIVIGGDSAGGNLTLAALLAIRDSGRAMPSGAFGLSPATDIANKGEGSREYNRAHDPMLAADGALDMGSLYVGGDAELQRDPYVSPLYGDLAGMPPVLLHVGSTEVLLDDSVQYVDKAQRAGVAAEVEVWDRMPHVWHMLPIPEAHQALSRIARFVREVTLPSEKSGHGGSLPLCSGRATS